MPFEKGHKLSKGRPKVENTAANLARKHVVEAIDKLVEQLRGEDQQIAHKAAVNLLDRAHGKPLQAVENNVVMETIEERLARISDDT